jgi:hypothetical protein
LRAVALEQGKASFFRGIPLGQRSLTSASYSLFKVFVLFINFEVQLRLKDHPEPIVGPKILHALGRFVVKSVNAVFLYLFKNRNIKNLLFGKIVKKEVLV